ncbi:hypothetical protein Tco_1236895 [Tanacetum coccineum]
MDSIIPLGQKNTLAEYMILSVDDNRPPMLDKDLVAKDLWERVQLLMQDLHATNFDQLHAYLEQHELYANEVRLTRERNQDPLALIKKEKDPEAIKQNISHKPIDYEKLNRLSDDFGKCFTLQQELSAEQAFWLRMSNRTSKPFDASTVKIEAPKELPKEINEVQDKGYIGGRYFGNLVMSDSEHSTVTYTSISSDDGSLDVGSPGVIDGAWWVSCLEESQRVGLWSVLSQG